MGRRILTAVVALGLLQLPATLASESSVEAAAVPKAKVVVLNQMDCKVTIVFRGDRLPANGKRLKVKSDKTKRLKITQGSDYTWTATASCCEDGAGGFTAPNRRQGSSPLVFQCTPTTGIIATPFLLLSSAFADGGTIPERHTCDGANESPELLWFNVPPGTRSLALVVEDPDAPGPTFTHWVLFDIPPDQATLGVALLAGDVGVSGMNDFGLIGYGGPCPPVGDSPHRYFFTLYALDLVTLGLDAGATPRQLERAIRRHVIGQVELLGYYGR